MANIAFYVTLLVCKCLLNQLNLLAKLRPKRESYVAANLRETKIVQSWPLVLLMSNRQVQRESRVLNVRTVSEPTHSQAATPLSGHLVFFSTIFLIFRRRQTVSNHTITVLMSLNK